MKTGQNQPSKISSRKGILKEILYKRDFDALMKWIEKTRNPFRTLISFQFDTDPVLCMRAVEGLGKVAGLYRDDLEILRKMLRRLFWMMNDESGNVGWHAPEAIGEVLRNVPELIPEYAPMLPAFLIEEPFEKGIRIAIARVSGINKFTFNPPVIKKLIKTLKDPDPEIRGTSILALKALAANDAAERVKSLENDKTEIDLYDFNSGEIVKTRIKDLAINF